jgi:hypothetical protein
VTTTQTRLGFWTATDEDKVWELHLRFRPSLRLEADDVNCQGCVGGVCPGHLPERTEPNQWPNYVT